MRESLGRDILASSPDNLLRDESVETEPLPPGRNPHKLDFNRSPVAALLVRHPLADLEYLEESCRLGLGLIYAHYCPIVDRVFFIITALPPLQAYWLGLFHGWAGRSPPNHDTLQL